MAAAIAPELRSIPNTEGSPAATIMLVVFGSIALFAVIAGLPLTIWGFLRLTHGASPFGRLMVAALVAPAVVFAVAHFMGRMHAPEPAIAQIPDRMDVPIHDFRAPRATLTLYRDEAAALQDAMQPVPARDEELATMWIDREPFAWRFRGFDCSRPPMQNRKGVPCHDPGAVMRHLPGLFKLQRVRMRAQAVENGCRLLFPFRGRIASVRSDGPCFERASMGAMRGAATQLQELGEKETSRR